MPTWKVILSFFPQLIALVVVPMIINEWITPLQPQSGLVMIPSALLILSGLAFIGWTSSLLAAFGLGTISHFWPPEKLVILGPMRFVRNPVMLGGITVLLGQTLLFNSFTLLGWTAIYWLFSHLWLIYKEEPSLQKRFGEVFTAYKTLVPRWIPLSKPVDYDPQKMN